MIDSTRVSDLVFLVDDLPSARALLEQRFAQVQHHWDLSLHNTAPATARLFVRVLGHKPSTTTLDLCTRRTEDTSRILQALDDEGRAAGTAERLETLG